MSVSFWGFRSFEYPSLVRSCQFDSRRVTFFFQNLGAEHLDFDNPLYREMMGLDAPQNPNDIFFRHDTNPVRYYYCIGCLATILVKNP